MKEAVKEFWKFVQLVFQILNDLLTPLAKEASDFKKEKESPNKVEEDIT